MQRSCPNESEPAFLEQTDRRFRIPLSKPPVRLSDEGQRKTNEIQRLLRTIRRPPGGGREVDGLESG
jgi:hypothetical protein